jgi:Ca2+-binding RTX toxin-like protein
MGTFVSVSGGDKVLINIYGNGTVAAGNGNDTIRIDGSGNVSVGAGNDSITLNGPGYILQQNSGSMIGNDTINLGSGNDTLTEAGKATVYGAFGSATVDGGKFQFLQVPNGAAAAQVGASGYSSAYNPNAGAAHGGGTSAVANSGPGSFTYQELAINGAATLLGGAQADQFIGGSGSVVMQGGTGNDTFMGGSGEATMTGGTGQNLFDFNFQSKGGTSVITNFVSGHDQLYLEGQSLSYLQANNDIHVSGGNTTITLDGGQTMVELKGFTGHLSAGDISAKG